MHLIRIEINDKKNALISMMKIKNALKLTMGVGGEGGGGEESISPHYRSEGRRQVSGGFFGGNRALSEDYRDKCHKI